MTCGSGPPRTIGQPRSTWSLRESSHSTMPPRGPRRDLCVVVVTIWACGTGSKSPVRTLLGDEAREVRHVDHEGGADLVGDLPHDPEVHETGVGGVAGDDDQRLERAGGGAQRLVVDQAGGRVGAVGPLVEHLAGDVGAEAVGEVAAYVQGHAEHPLVAEGLAQLGPVGLGEVVDLADAGLLQERRLDPVGEDGPEGDQVGVDAGVRLNVGVAGAEELLGVFGGERLDRVHVAAAA